MGSILIIGVGQLGSRHLQALCQVKDDLVIHLIDPFPESLTKAADIFSKTQSVGSHKLEFYNSVEDIKADKIDVAIIATSSSVRRIVTEQLLKKCKVDYLILEKVLFSDLADYEVISELLPKHNVKAWVNCPRRMFAVYREIKQHMDKNSQINISGSSWGLGCNGIHMLDIIAFLTGESNFILDKTGIDDKVVDSKREGYIEFTGSVTGFTETKKHHFSISSYSEGAIPLMVTIRTGNNCFVISESEKRMAVFTSGKPLEEKNIAIPFQSQLTDKVVTELLASGNCLLTPYEESAHLHKQFLKLLLSKLNENSDKPVSECKIT